MARTSSRLQATLTDDVQGYRRVPAKGGGATIVRVGWNRPGHDWYWNHHPVKKTTEEWREMYWSTYLKEVPRARAIRSRWLVAAVIVLATTLWTPALGSPAATGFESDRAGFAVRFRDVTVPYRVFMARVRPGERLAFEALAADTRNAPPAGVLAAGASTTDAFSAEASAGTLEKVGRGRFEWEAPAEPGIYPIRVRRAGTGDEIRLNAIVVHPLEHLASGEVHGYPIGDYPSEPYRGLPQYEPPIGFIELTPDNADTRVSPNFTLGQFPTKAPGGFPKYVVLTEKLLIKLEMLLEEANRRGLEIPTFQVLSGFRSPWYNAGIGRPRYSRHIYGDAADIYVDEDRNGLMDDLNRDGRIDLRDADMLYGIVEEMDGDASTSHLIGGLGKYPTTSNHGPFIHVDTREYRARW